MENESISFVGDGAKDQTQELKDALAKGNLIILPAGTMILTEPMIINRPTELYGRGNASTLLVKKAEPDVRP